MVEIVFAVVGGAVALLTGLTLGLVQAVTVHPPVVTGH